MEAYKFAGERYWSCASQSVYQRRIWSHSQQSTLALATQAIKTCQLAAVVHAITVATVRGSPAHCRCPQYTSHALSHDIRLLPRYTTMTLRRADILRSIRCSSPLPALSSWTSNAPAVSQSPPSSRTPKPSSSVVVARLFYVSQREARLD